MKVNKSESTLDNTVTIHPDSTDGMILETDCVIVRGKEGQFRSIAPGKEYLSMLEFHRKWREEVTNKLAKMLWQ